METFDIFWEMYPRKVAKQSAQKAWSKLENRTEVLEQIKVVLPKQIEAWAEVEKKYIPHPSTYINGRRWEDEVGGKKIRPFFRGYPARKELGRFWLTKDGRPVQIPDELQSEIIWK